MPRKEVSEIVARLAGIDAKLDGLAEMLRKHDAHLVGHAPVFVAKPTWDRQRRGVPLKPADVFGIWFNSMGRVAHVGLVEKNEGDWIVTIEGNTNGGGSRDGDGVYRRRRLSTNVLGRGWL